MVQILLSSNTMFTVSELYNYRTVSEGKLQKKYVCDRQTRQNIVFRYETSLKILSSFKSHLSAQTEPNLVSAKINVTSLYQHPPHEN